MAAEEAAPKFLEEEPPSTLTSCLECHWCGDSWFGTDVDDIFAYTTPRVSKIKDRTLGVTKYLLLLAIFSYVVLFQMAYNGEHFKVEQVEGVSRLQWQQPTANWCNPMNVDCMSNITDADALPYCAQYTGAEEPPRQRPCANKDAWELPINLPIGVLMPTHMDMYYQRRVCEVDAPKCERKFRFTEKADAKSPIQKGSNDAEPIRDVFVAEVEDFTVLIDHSFSTVSGGIAYDDYAMRGFWLDCSGPDEECVRRPIKCVHSKCGVLGFDLLQEEAPRQKAAPWAAANHSRQLRRRGLKTGMQALTLAQDAEEVTEASLFSAGLEAATRKFNVIALQDGDVLSMRTMLAMANSGSARRAPKGGYNLEQVVNSAGETRRMRGGALVIRIDYSNAGHWRLFTPRDPPSYTISATMRPAEEFKHLYVSRADPEGREVIKAYGMLIVVQQVGRICTFDTLHALIVIMTGMALLGMANVLTDLLALYVMPRKAEYEKWKYKESEDFVTVTSLSPPLSTDHSWAAPPAQRSMQSP